MTHALLNLSLLFIFVVVVNKYSFKLNLANVIQMPSVINYEIKLSLIKNSSSTSIYYQINSLHNVMDGAATSLPEVKMTAFRYCDDEDMIILIFLKKNIISSVATQVKMHDSIKEVVNNVTDDTLTTYSKKKSCHIFFSRSYCHHYTRKFCHVSPPPQLLPSQN